MWPFLQGNITATVIFLLGAMDTFLSETSPLILPAIRKIYGADGDGILEVDVSYI